MAQRVKRIKGKDTTGELGVLLLEMQLIKKLQPAYNNWLRKQTKPYAIQVAERLNDLPWLKIVPLAEIDPTNLAFLYGVFKTKKHRTSLLGN